MRRVQLASVRVGRLRAAAPLRAAFFDELLAPDLPRLILEWLDDPVAFKSACSRRRVVCLPRAVPRGLPPRPRRGRSDQGRRAARPAATDAWDNVWRRYRRSPDPATAASLTDCAAPRPAPTKGGRRAVRSAATHGRRSTRRRRRSLRAALLGTSPAGAGAGARPTRDARRRAPTSGAAGSGRVCSSRHWRRRCATSPFSPTRPCGSRSGRR